MSTLTSDERASVDRYCKLLARTFDDLLSVRIIGSAARGDMWPADSPMHSDIDLLVITRREPKPAATDEVVEATYLFYLECGRQISPQFFTATRLAHPEPGTPSRFVKFALTEGIEIWPVERAEAAFA